MRLLRWAELFKIRQRVLLIHEDSITSLPDNMRNKIIKALQKYRR